VDLKQIFQTNRPIIGVVHLLPLPTSARWGGKLKTVFDRAEQEATALAAGGVDGIIIENFFDAPFAKDQVDPAIVSAMTLIVDRIMNLVTIPVGINVLRNDSKASLAIASCTNAQFIRVNVLTGIMATDQGLIEGQAHQLLRYRRELGSDIAILADVLVKHARPLGNPDLTTAVKDTIERGLADGIIISGMATGNAPTISDLEIATSVAGETPVLIGSGADYDNIGQLISKANGVIVASSLKRQGKITEPIDPIRVSQFIEAIQRAI
jgi:membrane complex biogenesis BtpA family protein